MQRLLRKSKLLVRKCRHEVVSSLSAPFLNRLLVRVCLRLSTVYLYWVPFAEAKHMRLPPLGEAIIALPMLLVGEILVADQAWISFIGVADQVLAAVGAPALCRWLLAFGWILRGYTYGNRI